jgi:tRNA-specific 2-thiouridylase
MTATGEKRERGGEPSEPSSRGHAVVAMSGGVDSSVTAALLLHEGYRVTGITMRLFDPDPLAASDLVREARAVADFLGITHVVADFRHQFRQQVVDPFVADYRAGRTPNPCARCNRFIKFGLLLDEALRLGGDFLATGHYARIAQDREGLWHLRKGADAGKDQSYFLFSLGQCELSRVRFPLGEMAKEEVRQLARRFNLPCAAAGESQEICFVPDDDYVAFLEKEGVEDGLAGDIVHVDGTVLGRHGGIHRYTVGQRRGLGIAWPEPLYVVNVDARERRVVVGERQFLDRPSLVASGVNWIVPPAGEEVEVHCKIRYRQAPVPCTVVSMPEKKVEVRFAAPERGVTPGQVVAFYRGDELLGGGWIE